MVFMLGFRLPRWILNMTILRIHSQDYSKCFFFSMVKSMKRLYNLIGIFVAKKPWLAKHQYVLPLIIVFVIISSGSDSEYSSTWYAFSYSSCFQLQIDISICWHFINSNLANYHFLLAYTYLSNPFVLGGSSHECISNTVLIDCGSHRIAISFIRWNAHCSDPNSMQFPKGLPSGAPYDLSITVILCVNFWTGFILYIYVSDRTKHVPNGIFMLILDWMCTDSPVVSL